MSAPSAARRPNILILYSDTHSAFATGCYGSPVAHTPNLDRLAADGVLFERAYSQNPLCVPSRQSAITGKYSCQTGVLHNDQPMPALYTLGHHFSAAGYATAALGKMHFVPDTKASAGKERQYGFAARVDYEEFWRYARDECGLPPVPDVPDDPWRIVHLERWYQVLQRPMVAPVHPGGRPGGRGGGRGGGAPGGTLEHRYQQEALVLRAWERFLAARRQQPFLAVVSFQSPHPPFWAPEQFWSHDGGPIPLPEQPDEAMLSHPVWGKAARVVPDHVREERMRAFYADVSYTDWCAGEALRLLDGAGHRQDTLVVYLSDHGDMGFHHGLTGKTVFFEQSVQVPLILRLPETLAAGGRYRGLVPLIDLFPTLCEAAGIAPPAGLAGRSLWGDLLARTDAGREAVFSESYPMERNRQVFGPRPHRMVLTREWKLIQYGDICVDLYDTTRDPENRISLGDDAAYRAVKQGLLERLTAELGPLPEPES